MEDRMRRVNGLLRSEVSNFLTVNLELADALVTVTQVKTAKDLSGAKIFVSVYPTNRQGSALEALKSVRVAMQEELAGKLSMHRIPRFHFLIDAAAEKAAHINDILDQIEPRR